jgi:hypothetical protein
MYGIFSTCEVNGLAPKRWGLVDDDSWTRIKNRVYLEYPMLRYCEDDWKLHRWCTAHYPRWQDGYYEERQAKKKARRTGNKPTTTMKDTEAKVKEEVAKDYGQEDEEVEEAEEVEEIATFELASPSNTKLNSMFSSLDHLFLALTVHSDNRFNGLIAMDENSSEPVTECSATPSKDTLTSTAPSTIPDSTTPASGATSSFKSASCFHSL